jgi:hypothetical protein
MTKRQLTILAKGLLGGLPEFTVHGPMVVMQPLARILRAVCFSGASNTRGFYVHVAVLPLCLPTELVTFDVGWRVCGTLQRWSADEADFESKLIAVLRRDVVPFLSRAGAPHDAAEAAMALPNHENQFVQEAIGYFWALAGHVENACRAFENVLRSNGNDLDWEKAINERTIKVIWLLRNDLAAARSQLEAWETQTKANLGLQDLA